ncbi:plasmid replication protein RepC [Rhizobium sp. BG4]|uniref:plasmid replication protein RepC n=1 Tax=Rhizobium sp. BG4 TaxID=2613770 RepID=UPI00193E6892|nr:plasmid replication protein RepC [Rhizobium sp. BG4]QRM46620.1 replication initiation protein RepC [Rhizobium sp. BG4]
MDSGRVTTPFGRRLMTLGLLASQIKAQKIEESPSVDKWKIYRALCQAKPLLDISDRALAVLNALLSFYPHNELSSERNLVVFPSNTQLSIRCHGMAEPTVRRHMAALVSAGLVIRKDSPNGKRYARKTRQGDISEAYGFSLAPLLARAAEIERLAEKVAAERLHVQLIKERLTLCRRDISKLITAAVAEEAGGDWWRVQELFHLILNKLPRVAPPHLIASVLAELEDLRTEILKRLETQIKTENSSANDSQNERHIQITESESYLDSEARPESAEIEFTTVNSVNHADTMHAEDDASVTAENVIPRSVSLSTIIDYCPDIALYGPNARVRNWQDLIQATTLVSTMLQIGPSAYRQASAAMGPQNAAAVVACILQKGESVASPGGYLRSLARLAEQGRFNAWPMLAALRRNSVSGERGAQTPPYAPPPN